MDNELFELCKDVYERTGWTDEEAIIGHWCANDKFHFYSKISPEHPNDTPLYTSDYLLGKLPINVKDEYGIEASGLKMRVGLHGFYFHYGEFGEVTEAYLSVDKIPLKALLKLTIALHEAGELPN